MDVNELTRDGLEATLGQTKQDLARGNYSQARNVATDILLRITSFTEQLGVDIVFLYRAHFNMVIAQSYAAENDQYNVTRHCISALNAVQRSKISDQYLEACANYYVGMISFGFSESLDYLAQARALFNQLDERDKKVMKGRYATRLVWAYAQLLRSSPVTNVSELIGTDLEDVYAYAVEHKQSRMAIIAAFALVDAYVFGGGTRKECAKARRRLRAFFTYKAPSFRLAWFAFRLWIDKPPEPLFNPKEDAI